MGKKRFRDIPSFWVTFTLYCLRDKLKLVNYRIIHYYGKWYLSMDISFCLVGHCLLERPVSASACKLILVHVNIWSFEFSLVKNILAVSINYWVKLIFDMCLFYMYKINYFTFTKTYPWQLVTFCTLRLEGSEDGNCLSNCEVGRAVKQKELDGKE
jgi:hypothetical protein